MIKRAMISGLNAAGVDVADLRVSPPAVSRHVLKTQAFAAAVHVGSSHLDPEAIFIRIYEPPGILLTTPVCRRRSSNFTRQELRRVAAGGVGSVSYPARVRESYAQDLLDSLDAKAIRERRFRIVVDYGYRRLRAAARGRPGRRRGDLRPRLLRRRAGERSRSPRRSGTRNGS